MDRTIDRDSDAMKTFASYLEAFGFELEFYTADLKCNCSLALDMMQNKNGEEAISSILELSENIYVQAYAALELSDRITRSAILVEESNECK